MNNRKEDLQLALAGKVNERHRFKLEFLLADLEQCASQIANLDQRIAQYLKPHEEVVTRLDEVPGIDRTSAAMIVAEIGVEVKAWEDAGRLASWSCLCPGNSISAGKRLSGRTRRGNRWLRRGFCQTAWAATRKKGSYFKAQFWRIATAVQISRSQWVLDRLIY